MPRNASNSSRSDGRGGSNNQGSGNQGNNNLPPGSQSEVERLTEKLNEYLAYKAKVSQKLSQINYILNNFDRVVDGDILVDILPDENSSEILNSPIVTISELKDFIDNDSMKLLGDYTANDKKNLKSNIDELFADYRCTRFQELSNELDDYEMYMKVLKIILSDITTLTPLSAVTDSRTKLFNFFQIFELNT